MDEIFKIALYSIPLILVWWLFRTIRNISIHLKLIYELLKDREEINKKTEI